MKSNNGWIKYFAIAFGLVLALGIISAIVNGSIYVLQGLGLIENEFEQIGKPNGSYSQDYTEKPESISNAQISAPRLAIRLVSTPRPAPISTILSPGTTSAAFTIFSR